MKRLVTVLLAATDGAKIDFELAIAHPNQPVTVAPPT
jgi:hypothetical protein